MNRIFAMSASTAIICLLLTAGRGAEVPLPPCVNFVSSAAGQLYLGMTADDVIRIMGQVARETDVAIGETQIRKLEFVGAIPEEVILADGKVSRVTLDAFRMEKDPLPSSIRKAWPGFASSAVRRFSANPQPFFTARFSGSTSISGFMRVPATT